MCDFPQPPAFNRTQKVRQFITQVRILPAKFMLHFSVIRSQKPSTRRTSILYEGASQICEQFNPPKGCVVDFIHIRPRETMFQVCPRMFVWHELLCRQTF